MKNVAGDVTIFREQMREFVQLQSDLSQVKCNMRFNESRTDERFQSMKHEFEQLRRQVADFT